MFAKEKSAGNRKKAEKTETGKDSIGLIHAQEQINKNYVCFHLPLHLKSTCFLASDCPTFTHRFSWWLELIENLFEKKIYKGSTLLNTRGKKLQQSH